MTEQTFRNLNENFWKDFEKIIGFRKPFFKQSAAEFPAMLRRLTGDLNTARSYGFDPFLVERLNRLVLDGNQRLYAQHPFSLIRFAVFLLQSFPRAVRAHWRSFAACSLVFYGIALVSALLCVHDPAFSAGILGYRQMSQLEQMYDEESVYYLKPRMIVSDADMFGFYVYNNISIAFRTFAGGIFAGIGSLFFLIFNAFTLGAAAGHIIQTGHAATFFSFTSGHSAFELTGIILSAESGLLLGYSFFVTRGHSRLASLRLMGKTVFPLLSGAVFFIFLAAIIEAFWSSQHTIGHTVHYAVGIALWLLLIAYLLFCGRLPQKTARQKTAVL